MSTDVHGALWVNDLFHLPPAQDEKDGYVLAMVGEGSAVAYFTKAAGLTEAVYAERLAEGHRAYAAWQRPSGNLAGWCWAMPGPGAVYAPPIEAMLHFSADECYGFEAEVSPAHRGHRLFAKLLQHAGRHMAEQGRRWMWGGILDANMASRCSCAAAGFQPILHVRFQPVTQRLRTRPVEYADDRLVRRARETLTMPARIAVAS